MVWICNETIFKGLGQNSMLISDVLEMSGCDKTSEEYFIVIKNMCETSRTCVVFPHIAPYLPIQRDSACVDMRVLKKSRHFFFSFK